MCLKFIIKTIQNNEKAIVWDFKDIKIIILLKKLKSIKIS